MKLLISSLVGFAFLATAAGASADPYHHHRHQVCVSRHHHRVCHWA